MDFSGKLIILQNINNEEIKDIKSIKMLRIYINMLTKRKIIPTTTAIIAPSTNKSFHV